MADVQLENGYIRIANELFEQFYVRNFTLKQLRILTFIVRLSYGCNKKEAVITPQNLFELAHIDKSDILNEIRKLHYNKVINCDIKKGIFCLNKNFDEWKVSVHPAFFIQQEKYVKLLQNNIQRLASEVGELPTNELVNYQQIEPEAEEEKVGELPTSWQNTNKEVGELPTNELVNYQQIEPENADSERDTNPPKDILKTSKDILNTCIYKEEEKISEISPSKSKENISLMDPYFNPFKTEFEKQYKNIYHRSCILNNFQLPKILEMASAVPDFIEVIPEMIKKLSKIRFEIKGKKEKQTVGLRWLIDDGNWAGVLRGEFDQYIEEEKSDNLSFFEQSAKEFEELMNEGEDEDE